MCGACRLDERHPRHRASVVGKIRGRCLVIRQAGGDADKYKLFGVRRDSEVQCKMPKAIVGIVIEGLRYEGARPHDG
jgi:hypothetical protein